MVINYFIIDAENEFFRTKLKQFDIRKPFVENFGMTVSFMFSAYLCESN